MAFVDPATTLAEPVANQLIPPAMDQFLHIGDLLSLGHWAFVAIDMMGGPDIPEAVAEWFAGDWSEVSRAADAMRHLGEFCTVAAGSITFADDQVLKTWSGRAASSADSYFDGLSASLTAQAPNFTSIGGQFETAAFGVQELANAAGSLVETLADYAIMAGISLAAAAASSWTIIGGIIGGGSAAYAIARGVKTIAELMDIRAKVWMCCEALMGLIAGPLSVIKGFSSVQLPLPYDHPDVP